MKRLIVATVCCLIPFLFYSGNLLASGSGNHSHDHHAAHTDKDSTTIYKDSKDGIDAYLEFCDIKELTGTEREDFFVKCNVRAFLKDSKTDQYLQPKKLALRATKGHDEFGEAKVLLPSNADKMQTDLFVKNKGEHHYLLIAEIDGLGVKEFHFHHNF